MGAEHKPTNRQQDDVKCFVNSCYWLQIYDDVIGEWRGRQAKNKKTIETKSQNWQRERERKKE